MKMIPLSQGKFAKVSDRDFAWLNQWKWQVRKDHRTWYAVRSEMRNRKTRFISMHREILCLKKGEIGDHKDCNGLNNQRNNLRKATHLQNVGNKRKMEKGCSSRYKGVCWDRNKWKSYIRKHGRLHHLGNFSNEIDAAISYNKAAKKFFGSFALLNPIPS